MQEYRIEVKRWMTQKSETGSDFQFMAQRNNNIPMPMRVMRCVVLDETRGMYHIAARGHPEPSSNCLHCGKTLTHPVSLLYGIGPVCGGHYHINPFNTKAELDASYEDIKKKMSEITWQGWVIKSGIKSMMPV